MLLYSSMPVNASLFKDAESAKRVQQRYGGAMLNAKSLSAVQRLVKYRAPDEDFPMIRRAAVLVALFAGRSGELQLLLSVSARSGLPTIAITML
jgi:hypothetical protein